MVDIEELIPESYEEAIKKTEYSVYIQMAAIWGILVQRNFIKKEDITPLLKELWIEARPHIIEEFKEQMKGVKNVQ